MNLMVIVAGFVVIAAGCGVLKVEEGEQCSQPGAVLPCICTDGASGTQLCTSQKRLDGCICTSSDVVEDLDSDDAEADAGPEPPSDVALETNDIPQDGGPQGCTFGRSALPCTYQ